MAFPSTNFIAKVTQITAVWLNAVNNFIMIDLPNSASALGGAGLIGYSRALIYAAKTVGAQLRGYQNVLADGTVKGDGVTDDAAALNALYATGGNWFHPPANYAIGSSLTYGDVVTLEFSQGATIKPLFNNITIFSVPLHAYFSQVRNASVDGNAKTGIKFADVTNQRIKAGFYSCVWQSVASGITARTGCFGMDIHSCACFACPQALVITENCATLNIRDCAFDNEVPNGGTGLGTAIEVQNGGIVNEGVILSGGFYQGYVKGLIDRGTGTDVQGPYFELCTTADVELDGARGGVYRNIKHFGSTGLAGYNFINTPDSCRVEWPVMASGARTGLFNSDGTATNCRAAVALSNASYQTPLGTYTNVLLSPYALAYTQTDASGAGLALTQNATAYWSTGGETVTVTGDISYPVTASGLTALLALPVPAKVGAAINGIVTYQNFATALMLNGTGAGVAFYTPAGAALTNANLSGKRVAFSITYPAK